jgi:regulator of sirC expression with transglutaminase-like and TPR domain
LVAPGEGRIDGDLDHGALLIAAAIDPEVHIGRELERLDDLASGLTSDDPAGIALALFGGAAHDPSIHFSGNRADYYDLGNSMLNRVIERRTGIPITLSVLLIEVSRRRGVALHGVGMPGHFLVGYADGYIDPFGQGQALSIDGCRRLFQDLAGPGVDLPTGALDATPPALILKRVLANVAVIAANSSNRRLLHAVRSLLAAFPNVHYRDHVQHAYAAAELGQFGEAAGALERALPLVPESVHEKLDAQMDQWRARLN